MFTAERYVRPATLQEALELNRKRGGTILGGGCWLRLGRTRIGTLIDLSGLGLDQIEERDGRVRIGAMVSLRQLETSALLKERFGSLFADMTGQIVGVQFRECATFGGSVWGRFGFSDILTGLLALECEVELAEAGRIPTPGTSLPGRQTGIFWRQSGCGWMTEGSVPYCAQYRYRFPGAGLCCFPRGKGRPLTA